MRHAPLLLVAIATLLSAGANAAPGTASVSVASDELRITLEGSMAARFAKTADGKWKVGSFGVWNAKKKGWDEAYTSLDGSFLYLGKGPEEAGVPLFADECAPIRRTGVKGFRFSGKTTLSGAAFTWAADYFVDTADKLPLLHCDVTYGVDRDIDPGFSPKVITRTADEGASEQSGMTHIISYESGPKPILIERGYPLVWLRSTIDEKTHNCLLIDDVRQDSPAGRYLIYNRSPKPPYYTYWSVGSMRKEGSDFSKYYWNYRNPTTGIYPEETALKAGTEYRISCASLYSLDRTNLEFYREHWAKAFDQVCPMESAPFWSKDWEGCAKGQVNEFRDEDRNAGDRYVDGVGYFSAPKKDKMSHGVGNVCWHGTAEIIHAMLYYTWATGDKTNFDFYSKRLANANLPKWAASTPHKKGWINEYWIKDVGYPSWGSMWATLDFGAYNLYNSYKLTGDKTYWKLFKDLIDYVRVTQIAGGKSFGEHWNDNDEQWYYLTPESAFTKTVAIPKGADHGEYPGAMSVYAYLCLLTYNETKEPIYKTSAFSYIDYINTFLSHPQDFWTLCRVPKSNGFAFASLANVKRYELTKDPKYLDLAEEWAYLLMTSYHLRSEGHEDQGLAHASTLGVFDYVCVSSLETAEPMYLVSNILKYRANPTLLRYLSLADRRHLLAYPKTHVGEKFDYEYTPMELIPQRQSFAMYMAGSMLMENMLLHGVNSSSDPEITVICLDAAETGLGIKTSRNLLVFNPTSKARRFSLRLKGMERGGYRLTIDGGASTRVSGEALAGSGVEMQLGAGKWARVRVER